ncbi:3-hydroxyacyl-CoA dehydrogenase family protein [Polymorphospora rubra]|uniref:3-hydroxybutyryl-CoA dehydrogenase n=1 Tax=Polymorphospora rubra TaxID=338584 RepID=A0A810N4Y2_9ACTN|nr:3-hydroxyacyl-CoA dehydrogenase family protein [Polymorphospora rubra]BCJ68000.1 3-hydroxybutyryl-CoA dehydrogenase [Polymorphospora rubra]
MNQFHRIAVVGLGTMGSGIAQVFAASGRDVVALETDQVRAEAGIAAISAFLDGGVARGKVSADEKKATLARITTGTAPDDLADVDLVVESVTENLEVKREILAAVAAAVGDGTPIVTNTSALSVTALAAALPDPSRVAGLHFFNPAPVMRTVEVVRALQTSQDLVDRLVTLVHSLDGKQPIVVRDRPGFLINALLLPYLNDVIQEYHDGLATAEDIDLALKLGLGYRSGPLEMLDMIGLDVHLHATESMYTATSDARYAPPPLLRQMVAAGHLGTKNSKGFRTGEKKTR